MDALTYGVLLNRELSHKIIQTEKNLVAMRENHSKWAETQKELSRLMTKSISAERLLRDYSALRAGILDNNR